jgi:polyhydroxybutyrate depolymerase
MLCAVRFRLIPLLGAAALVVALGAAHVAPAGAAGASSTRKGSTGCGTKAAPGVTTRHVTVRGTDREYILSIPDGYDRAKPAPLLFDFHGLGSNMQEQSLYTHLDEQGGLRGYVVITPNGQGDLLRHWSLVPTASANPDVAFVQAILRTTNRTLCIDRRGSFSTGIPNGATFSTVLACALPGRLAAIAPVAGVNASKVCDTGTPRVSVLAFHGTADPVVPYQGGAYFSGASGARAAGGAQAMPVDDATAAWAKFDGCGTPPTASFVADDVQHLVWPDCPANGTVELYRILGGGHTWPGSTPVRASQLGSTSSSISATRLMLDFFHAHPRKS